MRICGSTIRRWWENVHCRPVFMISLAMSMTFAEPAQSDEHGVDNLEPDDERCFPEVVFSSREYTWRFCLDKMSPGYDSCAEVTFRGTATRNAEVKFIYAMNRIWEYGGTKSSHPAAVNTPLRIDMNTGTDGNLARITIRPADDSIVSLALPDILNDRPDTTDRDTGSHGDLNITRMVYYCHRIEYKVVVEERIFVYPGNFRRDPRLNYPEHAMFHYGGSVRMPTARSLEDRAQLCLYWHIFQLPDLEYEDPGELYRKETWRNRLGTAKTEVPPTVKKKKRPPLISFKALQ